MTIRHYVAVVLLPIAIGAACNGRPPTTPTRRGEPVSTGPVPVPAPAPPFGLPPATVEMTGVVRGDDGSPLVAAKVTVSALASSAPGTWYSYASAATNALGAYTLRFSGVSGVLTGPAGTQTAVAFAYVSAEQCTTLATLPTCGYEPDYRYVLSATPLIQNFRLHRVSMITAGESTVLTVAPDDTICVNNVQDMHPWPNEFVCRTVRVVAPADGVMTLEAVPVDAGTAPPNLEVETVGDIVCCSERIANPASLPVTKGTVVKASVEVPWGTAGNHSFVVKTSIAAK